jgi:formylglycine-generating enzyme required for sulfatase activity
MRRLDDGFAFTAPVGAFAPNKFGLYDTFGYLWGWVLNCWSYDHKENAVDGAPGMRIAVTGFRVAAELRQLTRIAC